MRRIGLILFAFVLLALAAVYFFRGSQSDTVLQSVSVPVVQVNSDESSGSKKPTITSAEPVENIPTSNEGAPQSVWKLDSSNFEYRVQKCFQGEACTLEEDPLTLYQFFKKAGNRKANDLLISYLRKYLKEPFVTELYKKSLKAMIDDFYPREEKQFQEAAYYNYLGDLDKSLALYLDLEKKSALDPTLQKAPKLNIANTYYDLGRFREALPYYEIALSRWTKLEVKGEGHDDVVRFIERRIEEIKAIP